MSTIDQIDERIQWLNDHNKSNNLVEICKKIDELSILLITIGHEVSAAYALMNNLEDEYKVAYARVISQSSKSAVKAEFDAEIETKESKRNYTTAKNGYKRLSIYQDRVDRVIESYRQMVSVAKMDLTNETFKHR